MAYWALYKWFKPWRKLQTYDIIYYFGEYVVKTPEQRQAEEEKRRINFKATRDFIRCLAMTTENRNMYSYLMGRLYE